MALLNRSDDMSTFEPKIVAFVCNWCTYAGADLTGTSRIKYAPNVRIIRFPCTGRIISCFCSRRLRKGQTDHRFPAAIQRLPLYLRQFPRPQKHGWSSRSLLDFIGNRYPQSPVLLGFRLQKAQKWAEIVKYDCKQRPGNWGRSRITTSAPRCRNRIGGRKMKELKTKRATSSKNKDAQVVIGHYGEGNSESREQYCKPTPKMRTS